MKTRVKLALFCLLLSLALSPAFAEEEDFRVLPLHYRSASDLLPVVQGIFGTRVKVTIFQDKLVARGSTANLDQVEKFIREIDRVEHRLRIESRIATKAELVQEQMALNAQVKAGNVQAQVKNPVPAGGGSVGVASGNSSAVLQARSGETGASAGNTMEVQALENHPVALRNWSQQSLSPPRGVGVGSNWVVRARLQGKDLVTVEVGATSADGQKEFTANSEIEGQLGQWMAVARIDSSSEQKSSGILSKSSAQQSGQKKLWVRVHLQK